MLPNFLSVDNIAFTIIGYPLSYVELAGTLLYLWSVWLISRRRMLTWPVGIVSVLLYMALFYQIRLYSDTFEQVYYLGASIYGWWMWHASPKDAGQITDVIYSNRRTIFLWIAVTAIVSVLTGFFMSRIHILFPVIFPPRPNPVPDTVCRPHPETDFVFHTALDLRSSVHPVRVVGLLSFHSPVCICRIELSLM